MTPVAAPRAIVFLHGYDDDPAVGARHAAGWAPKGTEVVAPVGPVATPNGAGWYRSDELGLPDRDDVEAALAIVSDAISALADHGVPTGSVILAGFSQGAALALAWALRETPRPTPVAGLVAVAGWLPDVESIGLGSSCAAAAVLFAHGEDDEVVPLPLGRSVARLLDRRGVPVTFVEQPVGHTLEPFAPDIRAWIADAPGAPSP